MSTLLNIRETQIKITARYHITPVRMAIANTLQTISVERMWRQGNPPSLSFPMYIGTYNTENGTEVHLKNNIEVS